MKNTLFSVSILAGLAGAVVCGCAHEPGDTNAPDPNPRNTANIQAPRDISPMDLTPGGGNSSDFIRQPAAHKEVALPAPGDDYYWVSGYWNWNGGEWVWVKGVWDKPKKAGASWSSAHWINNDGKVTWVVGQWR